MQRDRWGKWVVAGAVLAICISGATMLLSMTNRKTVLTIGAQVVHARIADTEASRRQGLSDTKPLGENEAMLFVYDSPTRPGIWMKDMNYSLDIVWLDETKKVVSIERDVSPETYPRVFLPQSDAQYVIELPAGFAMKHGLSLGQVVNFSVR